MASLERSRIEEALHAAGGNISRAAAQLGLPRNTLRYRMDRHGLTDGAAGAKRKRASDTGAARPAEGIARDRAVADPVRWQRTRVTLLEVHVPDADAIVAEHERHRALEQAAAKAVAFGGRVIDFRASGLVAAFGLEPAEDTPRHAAHAALAMLQQRARAASHDRAVAAAQNRPARGRDARRSARESCRARRRRASGGGSGARRAAGERRERAVAGVCGDEALFGSTLHARTGRASRTG